MFLYMVIKVLPAAASPVDPMMETLLTIIALASVVVGLVLPRILPGLAKNVPDHVPQAQRLQSWFTRSVLGFAFVEACSLFGIALHALGASLHRSELLIGIGIVATVFVSAGEPPTDEGESGA
jgi:hypothetical protein